MTTAALGGIGCSPEDPSLISTGQTEQGDASWYGPGFDGNNTANGEVYDQEAMTAAHKTLPFGTIVRVTSMTTARCVFVRINDRGPYIDGRIIDLSHGAAKVIGLSGVAPVQLTIFAAKDAVAPAS
jgi:rare lipoprotein A